MQWRGLGSSPVPVRVDGSKAPDSTWKAYEQQAASVAEIDGWFGPKRGLGVVTGFGGVELLEFEREVEWVTWCRLMVSAGLADELRALCGGYLARSGGGGYHLIFRTETPEKNTVLAGVGKGDDVLRYLDPSEPGGFKRSRVLIETRGVGGVAVVAGGDPGVHPTGVPYRRIVLPEYLARERLCNWELDPGKGVVILDKERAAKAAARQPNRVLSPAPDHLYEVSPELRETMFALARQLDRRTPTQVGTGSTASRLPDHQGQGIAGARPGEAWASVTTWDEILEPHGWRRDHSTDVSDRWTRPGKSSGTSATTNYNGNQLLYVYTSSTDFEPETSYTKFGAYAVLNHEGDFKAAAAELVDKGFADPMTAEADSREQRVAQMAIQAEDRLEANEIARCSRASRSMRIPPTRTMLDALEAPLPVPPQLVEGLVIGEGVTLLSAQNKTGKSTVGINLVRAVLYGEDLFGRYPTHLPSDAGVGVWNAEVSASTYEQWMIEHGLDDVHAKRLTFLHLAGYPVDLLLPAWREQTVSWLREHKVKLWVLDPFSKIFRGDENSATEVNAWWMALREIMAEADVPAAFVIHHAGHTDDDRRARARGSSAIEGDPEVVLSYQHGGKPGGFPPSNKRYLSGVGRIDDIPSLTLDYDQVHRRLFVDENSQGIRSDRQAQDDSLIARIAWGMLPVDDADVWVSKQKLKDADTGFGDRKTIEAIDRCVARGYLAVEQTPAGKPDKVRRGRNRPPGYVELNVVEP